MTEPPKHFIAFNQDYACFAVAVKSGFRIYNVDPFQEMFQRSFPEGGIAIIEMLFRSNILGIVAREADRSNLKTKLMIWDDHQNRSIGEISFKTEIVGIRLSRENIIVILEKSVHLYDFRNFNLIHSMDTVDNKAGLCALAPIMSRQIIACPGTLPGQLRVLASSPSSKSLTRPTSSPKAISIVFIPAHTAELAAVTLNPEGTLVATASTTGTIIRVFNTETAALLHEMRRGTDQALIYSLCFDSSSSYVACSSDKGTIHIFSLIAPAEVVVVDSEAAEENGKSDTQASSSSLSMSVAAAASSGFSSLFSGVRDVLPKFITAERSYAQFRIPDCNTRNIVAFCGQDAIAVITADSRYFKANFANGGECSGVISKRFGDW